jgi:snRNA-activating protein complex subunit 3
MNAGMAHAHESHFGPPSELIHISNFITQAIELENRAPIPCTTFDTATTSILGKDAWLQLPEDSRNEIASECRCVAFLKKKYSV